MLFRSLNKLYYNNKINEAFSLVKAFFSSENIAICVFVLVIIVATILIMRYARETNKNAPPDKIPFSNSANNDTGTDSTQPPQTSTSTTQVSFSNSANDGTGTDSTQPPQMSTSITQIPPKVKDTSLNILFFIIFVILLLVIAAVIYLLIAKYNMVTNIINDADKGSNILTYLLLAVSAITLIILSFIIIAATARSISRLIYQIPEYIRRADVSEDRIELLRK